MSDFIEKQVSQFVDSQFPSFYKEEGPIFIEFVKEYYRWMESSNNAIYHSRRFFEYTDVDDTAENFLLYFKEKYLKNIQFDTNTNTRELIKHALDIFRAKGSERAVDLLFRLVFGVGAELYYPSTDIFKLSDGKWLKPTYLEISLNEDAVGFVGKQIIGVTSGATAFCERVVRRTINGRLSDVLYISNIYGVFRTGEKINTRFEPISIKRCPTVVGSLNRIEVDTFGTGAQFSVGQIVNISSFYGNHAKGRVANVANVVGTINFTLVNGGYAYSNNPVVIVSDTNLTLSNVTVSNSQIVANNYFPLFAQIYQPHAYINYVNSNGSFTNGSMIYTYHANNDVKGIATVISAASINSTAGLLNLVINSGNMESNALYSTSNTIGANTATSNGYIDVTYSANVFAESSNITLSVTDYISAFSNGEVLYQIEPVSNLEVANAIFQYSNNVIGSNADIYVSNLNGIFRTGLRVRGRTSNNSANVKSLGFKIGVIDANGEFTNSVYNIFRSEDLSLTGTITYRNEGLNAGFDVSSDLLYSENIEINSDYLATYANIELGANEYNFPANPVANGTNLETIDSCLTFANTEIGKLYSLISINPGSNYNEVPFIRVFEPKTYYYLNKDDILYVANLSSSFTIGELITQSSTGARGIIKSGSNSTVMFIERLNFYESNTFAITTNSTSRIVGFQSGSTANVTTKIEDTTSEYLGFNAVIGGALQGANGAITSIEVIDSGFGFMNDEEIIIAGNTFIGLGRANVYTHGTGSGFYQQKGGFLSDQKKLFDGYYYQNFSYEVRSSITLNKYLDMLKQILHVSGSQHFGRFVYNSEANVTSNILSADITIESM